MSRGLGDVYKRQANDIRDLARAIEDSEDFVLMSCYPGEGCVQVIGDCMVIKLSEQDY